MSLINKQDRPLKKYMRPAAVFFLLVIWAFVDTYLNPHPALQDRNKWIIYLLVAIPFFAVLRWLIGDYWRNQLRNTKLARSLSENGQGEAKNFRGVLIWLILFVILGFISIALKKF